MNRVLVILFYIIVSLPIFQQVTGVFNIAKLKGDVTLLDFPSFTVSKWFEGEFQEGVEKYFNDQIGFRPAMVRIRNQVDYSLFDKTHANSVIIGKEKFLYEKGYIKDYYGLNFLGGNVIERNVARFRRLQDSLEALDKTFLVCLAPGKATFYPEYIPDKYSGNTDSTNYKTYKEILKKEKVNHIDFNKWFFSLKDTSPCLLYTKYGIHWSYYGMLLASDSLIKYVEQERQINMPDVSIREMTVSKQPRYTDYDLGDGLNLLWKLETEEMCYPGFEWTKEEGQTLPRAIVAGDSYYWQLYELGLHENSFSPGGFWYYNNRIYDGSGKTGNVGKQDFTEVIENNDVFIIMTTESNLVNFPWGFVSNMLLPFDRRDKVEINFSDPEIAKQLRAKVERIKKNREWMKDIQRKAKLRGISVDSMTILDAKWALKNK